VSTSRPDVDVILKVAALVEKDPASIIELDINPLMLLADGQGVVAADALIGLNAEFASDPRKESGLRKANPNE
jgi:succinyl-CoA synthetase beta subunit